LHFSPAFGNTLLCDRPFFIVLCLLVSWCVGFGGSFAILALCGWIVRIANVPPKALVCLK